MNESVLVGVGGGGDVERELGDWDGYERLGETRERHSVSLLQLYCMPWYSLY